MSSGATVCGRGGISATRLRVCRAAPISVSAAPSHATKNYGRREVQASAEKTSAIACSVRFGAYAGGRSLGVGGAPITAFVGDFILAPCPTAGDVSGPLAGGTTMVVSLPGGAEI